MKKTIISLATASLIASSAMAADKGIDFTTTGQAVVYYQTTDTAGDDLFDQKKSSANVGIQLDLASDLKNGFGLGAQLSYLGTTGLEKNLVSGVMQTTNANIAMQNTSDEIALTKIYLTKKVANTTVKLGRQELPKSLSPLAFSEGWNVFKNTFEAALVVNTDIPDTVVVGAYVGQSNNGTLGQFGNLTVKNTTDTVAKDAINDTPKGAAVAGVSTAVTGPAYMLTVQNKSLPMTTITASVYGLNQLTLSTTETKKFKSETVDAKATATDLNSATAVWLDVKIADKSLPMGLKIGLQAGSIMTDHAVLSDTTAFGAKASVQAMDALTVCAAYSHVSGEKDNGKQIVAIRNTGTGNKTPLYTQMVANQKAIALDNNSFMLKGAYNLGDMGKVIAQGSYTTAGQRNINGNGEDNREFDLLYVTKVSGMNLLAAYVNTKNDSDDVSNHIVRVVARYAF